jgi:hypothetical protein
MKDRYGLNMSGTTKDKAAFETADDDADGEEVDESTKVAKTPKTTTKTTTAKQKTALKTPAAKKEKAPAKAKTPATKTPAARKRKAAAISDDVSFPGLDSTGDADVSASDGAEKQVAAEEDESKGEDKNEEA